MTSLRTKKAASPTPIRLLGDLLKKKFIDSDQAIDLPKPFVDVRHGLNNVGERTGETVVSFRYEQQVLHRVLAAHALEKRDRDAVLDMLRHPAFDAVQRDVSAICRHLLAARARECFILAQEGLHRLQDSSLNTLAVFVYDGLALPMEGASKTPLAICAPTSGRSANGTPKTWLEATQPILSKNPLVLLPLLASLATPLVLAFGAPGATLHVFGLSSTGKSAVGALTQSLGFASSQLQDCRGTALGIAEAIARECSFTPILDETHLADDPDTLRTIAYAASNQSQRLVSERASSVKVRTKIAAPPVLFGERSIDELLPPQTRTALGLNARLVEFEASAEHGMFSNLPLGKSAAEVADFLKKISREHGGHLYVRWLSLLSAEQESVRKWMVKRVLELKCKLAADLKPDDSIALRQTEAVAVWVFAGQLATKLRLWEVPMDASFAAGQEAVRQAHAVRRSTNASSVNRDILEAVRDLLESRRAELQSFEDYHHLMKAVLGYRYVHAKEGDLILLHGNSLMGIERTYGKSALFSCLATAGYLVATDGLKLQVRLPKDRHGKRDRRSFYALRSSILSL